MTQILNPVDILISSGNLCKTIYSTNVLKENVIEYTKDCMPKIGELVKRFSTKKPALEYLASLESEEGGGSYHIFQQDSYDGRSLIEAPELKDKGKRWKKKFLVTTYNWIFDNSKIGLTNYYESIEYNEPVKLFIDVDGLEHKEDLDQILINIHRECMEYFIKHNPDLKTELDDISVDNWMRAYSGHKDEGHSFHCVLPDVHFPCISQLRHREFKQIMKKHGADDSVYRVGAFRCLYNVKLQNKDDGWKRTLLIDNEDVIPDERQKKERFYFDIACIKNTDDCGVLIDNLPRHISPIQSPKNAILVHNELTEEDKQIISEARELHYITNYMFDCIKSTGHSKDNSWRKVLRVCKNIGIDFEIWDVWDKARHDEDRKTAYDFQRNRTEWDNHTPEYYENCNEGTIHFIAKEHNEQQYNVINNRDPNKDIPKLLLEGSDSALSDVVRIMLSGLICVNKEKKKFIRMNDDGIYQDEDKHIYNCIKTTMWKRIHKESSSILLMRGNLNPDSEEGKMKEIDEHLKQLKKVAASLHGIKKKENIIKELAHGTFEPNIYRKLNSPPLSVLPFSNIIYDLAESVWRKPKPEEYIYKTADYAWDEKKLNKGVQDEIYKFWRTLFYTKEKTDYVLKTIASSLLGQNRFQEFYIWTGVGSNGKSLSCDLLENTFNKLFSNVPPEFWTIKKKSGETAEPCMASMEGVRVLFSSEPDSKEKLQVGKVKLLTGGDTISTRNLYEGQFEFKPQFTSLLGCNKKPLLSDLDLGIRRRIRIIDFPFIFIDDPKEAHEKKADHGLTEKVKSVEWRYNFMQMLIDIYNKDIKIQKGRNLPAPDCVVNDSKEYMEECNPIKSIFNDMFVYSVDTKGKASIKRSEVMRVLKEETRLSQANITNFLEQMGVKGKKSVDFVRYIGYTRRYENNDYDSSDDVLTD